MASSSGKEKAKKQKVTKNFASVLRPNNLHQFLRFENTRASELERERWFKKLEVLRKKDIFQGKIVDWDFLEHLGVKDKIVEYLTFHPKRNGKVLWEDKSWVELFSIDATVYRELCLEFYSTYEFDRTCEDWDNKSMLRFRLCGTDQKLSLKEFARVIGLYPKKFMDHKQFSWFLSDVVNSVGEGLDNRAAWEEIANGESGTREMIVKYIREPALRVIHRMIKFSLTTTGSGHEKVNLTDLWYMYHIWSDKMINLPYCLAHSLTTLSAVKSTGKICGGHFITRLAGGLGLLTPSVLATLHPTLDRSFITPETYVGMNVASHVGPNLYKLNPPLMEGEERPYFPADEEEAEDDDEEEYVPSPARRSSSRPSQNFDPAAMASMQAQVGELIFAMHCISQHCLWQQDTSMEFYRRNNFEATPPPGPMWDMFGHYRQDPRYPVPPSYTPQFGNWFNPPPPPPPPPPRGRDDRDE